MDTDTKLFLGKILGEVYRSQKSAGMGCPVSDEELYGLLNGFEFVIDEVIEGIGHVTKEQHDEMAQVLDVYFSDPTKLAKLKGFYDIENELKERGVNRFTAISLVKYFRTSGRFAPVLDKFDSSHSPGELRNPRPGKYDR